MLKLITIDGPAGSGKSTVSHNVAEQLGWTHLNTGALYRALALLLYENSKSVDDASAVSEFVGVLASKYRQDVKTSFNYLGERNITSDIRSPKVSESASLVAKNEFVRQCLLPVQRQLVANANGSVVDGRDMGTIVFADSPLKVFLTASPEQRAERRKLELAATGRDVDLQMLIREITDRDERDANRTIAPMKPAFDAIVIDSTHLDAKNVVNLILEYAKKRGLV